MCCLEMTISGLLEFILRPKRAKSGLRRADLGHTAAVEHRGTFAFVRLFNCSSLRPPPDSKASLKAQMLALRSKSQPQDPNPSLKTQIPASRLKSQPQGPNPSSEV